MSDTTSFYMKTVLLGTGIAAIACFVSYSLLGKSTSSEKAKEDGEKFPVFKKANSNSSSSVVKDGSGGDESMRGYKKLADGRTTSYFSREITDEDRRLLAETNTGPQRIDPGSSPSFCASPIKLKGVQAAAPGGSKWNSAGTYEEKDISSWAQSQLRSLLTHLNVRLAGGTPLNVYIDVVHEVKGDASCVFSRGKCKFIYDMSLEIGFLITNSSAEKPSFVLSRGDTKGKISITDITADADDDVVHCITDVIGRDTDRRAGGIFQTCIGASISRGSTGTLLHAISEALKTFLVDMRREFEKPNIA
jgi:hypothetical protein